MKLWDQFNNDLTGLQIQSWKGEQLNFQLLGQRMNNNLNSPLKKSNELLDQLMQDFKKKNGQIFTSPIKNVSMRRHASDPNLSPAKRPCPNSPELAWQLPTQQHSIESNSDDVDVSVLSQALDAGQFRNE